MSKHILSVTRNLFFNAKKLKYLRFNYNFRSVFYSNVSFTFGFSEVILHCFQFCRERRNVSKKRQKKQSFYESGSCSISDTVTNDSVLNKVFTVEEPAGQANAILLKFGCWQCVSIIQTNCTYWFPPTVAYRNVKSISYSKVFWLT